MAACKDYRVSGRSKKTKKNVVIAVFLKIETRLKVLYVRLKGIPEGDLKAFIYKAFRGSNKGTENHLLFLYNLTIYITSKVKIAVPIITSNYFNIFNSSHFLLNSFINSSLSKGEI